MPTLTLSILTCQQLKEALCEEHRHHHDVGCAEPVICVMPVAHPLGPFHVLLGTVTIYMLSCRGSIFVKLFISKSPHTFSSRARPHTFSFLQLFVVTSVSPPFSQDLLKAGRLRIWSPLRYSAKQVISEDHLPVLPRLVKHLDLWLTRFR